MVASTSEREHRLPRPSVQLSLRCDGACVFCAQVGLPPREPGDDNVHAALDAARARGDEVTFVGGEPLLAERLVAHVRAAKERGFSHIGVQTNGVLLAADGAVRALAEAGLTDVHFSLHGARPEVHDFHAGRDGALVAAVAAMRAARAAGLSVTVTSVLTRSSFRVVSEVPRLLAQHGVAAWCIALPVARGRAEASFDRVMPRLALALPFALHAMDAARTLGMPAFLEGAPLCLVGPFAPRVLRRERRAYGAACEGCAARDACPGVDAAYLARFDGDELSAERAPKNVDALGGRDAELARTFVGVGETAPPAEPSAKPRVSLPLAGKVQPGRQEVSRGAGRKSGEALRDLFPALFAPRASSTHEWPVETVLVGSGRRARALATAARGAPGLVIVAVASPHAPDTAPLDAEGALVVRTLDEALAAREPKAMIVASSTDSHAPAVRAAIARALPVLVEKPVASTPAETKALADEARARGATAMPAWQLALLPGLDVLAAAKASDLAVTLAFARDGSDAPRDATGVFEPLVHALSVVAALTAGRALDLDVAVDAQLDVDDDGRPRRHDIRFRQDGGLQLALVLDFMADAESITVRAADLTLERVGRTVTLGRGADRSELPGGGSDAERLLAHFRDVVRGDASPRFTLDDAARVEQLAADISR